MNVRSFGGFMVVLLLSLTLGAIAVMEGITIVQKNQRIAELEEQVADLEWRIEELKEIIQEKVDELDAATSEEQENVLEEQNVQSDDADSSLLRKDVAESDGVINGDFTSAEVDVIISEPAFIDEAWRYLEWRYDSPGGYAHLIQTGRELELGLEIFPATEEFKRAARIAEDGADWDRWLEHRGFTHSPYYGNGVDWVYYLDSRGRDWVNAMATLEKESTYGIGGSNHFGVLWQEERGGGIEHYCDYLDYRGASNDPLDHAIKYNDNPPYWETFGALVSEIRGHSFNE